MDKIDLIQMDQSLSSLETVREWQDEEISDMEKVLEQCIEEGSHLPMLKQELWLKIQHRRLSNGQPELEINTINSKKNKQIKLTEDEVRKRNRRKHQNRESAIRCRIRQHKYTEKLEYKVHKMEAKGNELRTNIQMLEMEKNELLRLLQEHICSHSNNSAIL